MTDIRKAIIINTTSAEVLAALRRCKRLCARLQTMTSDDEDYRRMITELIPSMPASTVIIPPFQCDYGTNIILGEHVFINGCCCFLDGATIRIGDNTLIGPNCQLYTPHHPIGYMERRKQMEYSIPISIGSDCWLGGNVTVCPGVEIGDRCVVAAGSVVTKSFPAGTLIAGNPAVVKRTIG